MLGNFLTTLSVFFLSVRSLESWHSNTWLSDDFYFLLLKCVFKCGVDVDHTLASLKCERKYILPLHTQIRFQKHLDYNLRSRFFFLKKELARRERIYNQQLLKNEKSKDYCHNNVYMECFFITIFRPVIPALILVNRCYLIYVRNYNII